MSVNGVEDEEKVVEAGNPGNVLTESLTISRRVNIFFQELWTKFLFGGDDNKLRHIVFN